MTTVYSRRDTLHVPGPGSGGLAASASLADLSKEAQASLLVDERPRVSSHSGYPTEAPDSE